jgi:hypothetical protein
LHGGADICLLRCRSLGLRPAVGNDDNQAENEASDERAAALTLMHGGSSLLILR